MRPKSGGGFGCLRVASRTLVAGRYLLAALAIFILASLGATSSALAGCDGGSPTENCTGALSTGVQATSPSVMTLNVNSLTTDITPGGGIVGISLTGTGSAPLPVSGQLYTGCSTPGDCTITGGGTACSVNNGSPSGTVCTFSPVSNGNSGQAGPSVTITYLQPGANPLVVNSGSVFSSGAAGILGVSTGSNGGNGGTAIICCSGGDGQPGADGGSVTVTGTGAISTSGEHAPGIAAASIGGNGGDGGDCDCVGGSGGNGGGGGQGGTAQASLLGGSITTINDYSVGIAALSQGGSGGSGGGGGGIVFSPGGGNSAGAGGLATVNTSAGTTITTSGIYSHGVLAQSIGGGGGSSSGGFGLFDSSGGSGGTGGNGGTVVVNTNGSITTIGDYSQGILAESIGGGGGDGASNSGLYAAGASGAAGGNGGSVTVTNTGLITTYGYSANAIEAQSIGGGGGNGGSSSGAVSLGGSGSSTSPGGIVEVTNTNTLNTYGSLGAGILAQSIGGGGGNGGMAAGVFSAGGSGGGGGDGMQVTVTNSGSIVTGLNVVASNPSPVVNAPGIFAQSVGGGGGNGGGAIAGGPNFGAAIGASGGDGGSGGGVSVLLDSSNTPYSITTYGASSNGITAQSIGGGGGSGGFAVAASAGLYVSAAIALGGSGGNGGGGGAVIVNSAGTIKTNGADSNGIFAESVGGGGGSGGFAVAASASNGVNVSFAMGGSGGDGGAAGTVSVTTNTNITTVLDHSAGIFAQSVGGGGGDGGFSVAAGAATAVSLDISLGNQCTSCMVGGAGNTVNVNSTGNIQTSGMLSYGIFAQSVGGGGGNGGFSIGFGAAQTGGAVSVTLAGSGGVGGAGSTVNVSSDGNITTGGAGAIGIFAQSVGGGGGNGGFAVSAAGSQQLSAAVSVGGTGAMGGIGGNVEVDNTGIIQTGGSLAYGIFAQSVGGGGGNGGFSIAGTLTTQATGVSVAIGGGGGTGQTGGSVTVNSNIGATLGSTPTIETTGAGAYGIFAQSIGGGGGSGGFSGSLSVGLGSSQGAIGVSVGGSGTGGGDGGIVSVTSNDNILTTEVGATAIFAQSVGGSGGDGGFSMAGAITAGPDASAITVAIGGTAGRGGIGQMVTVDSTGIISTGADYASGVVAQSVGGGGGNGGFAVSVSIAPAMSAGTVGVDVGGSGNGGGAGGTVQVVRDGSIATNGQSAYGIFAQSIGGGGGNGGMSISGDVGGPDSKNFAVTVGGGGGAGGAGGAVDVQSTGPIITMGSDSHAIFAQSVGGGGGNGGMAGAAVFGIGGDSTNINLGVSVGGNGGMGSSGNTVSVTDSGALITTGDRSDGILAQSIGGGGGAGGGAFNGLIALNGGSTGNTVNLSVAVGGKGGMGNIGGAVSVNQSGSIFTTGAGSTGIVAQSVGGGGGLGGQANTLSFVFGSSTGSMDPAVMSGKNANIQLNLGGNGGMGNDGGTVNVMNSGSIVTTGGYSDGIMAQSIGGGGGDGGDGVKGLTATIPDLLLTGISLLSNTSFVLSPKISIGGIGGASGDGNTVTITNSGVILTAGVYSDGIFAQSVGAGGGAGGAGLAGALGTLGIGGAAGGAGNGQLVMITNTAAGTINTTGDFSDGIFAQSVGGGGGTSGSSTGLIQVNQADFAGVNIGGAGSSGTGGAVTVNNDAMIMTSGYSSIGIFEQSVGGGGGAGGGAAGSLALPGVVTIGASGTGGGTGGTVTATNSGTIVTTGDGSIAILAQSIGAGGGSGGGGTAGLVLGGSAGSAGDGGAVIIGNSGMILTSGAGAIGLFGQSVGGGGGIGGATGGIGAVVTLGGASGAGGNGGAVTITNSAVISTSGNGATAIFAQSVGGGGGMETTSGLGTLDFKAAGGGSGGNGGVVSVTNTAANIWITGANAHGIFAQSVGGGGGVGGSGSYTFLPGDSTAFSGSVGGAGVGQNVTVMQTGNIIATGSDAYGILAQSVGGSGNGNISITVNSGMIVGGTGSGAGIGLLDGANNVVNNSGTVMSVSGLSGLAFSGSGGNNVINNFGITFGNVALGTGANAFNNMLGGLFIMGADIDLGAGNTLTNNGVISPGGANNVFTSSVNGNLVQSATGQYFTDIDLTANAGDRINVTGTANVAGLVDTNLINAGGAQPGTFEFTIINAAGGVTNSGLALNAIASPLISYALLYPDPDDVVLTYSLNFAPPGLSGNEFTVGNAINQIQLGQNSPGLGPVVAALFNIPTLSGLAHVYDQITGEGTSGTQDTAFAAANGFGNTIFNQAQAWLNGTNTNSQSGSSAGHVMQYASDDSQRLTTAFDALKSNPIFEPHWHTWVAGFGGTETLNGNAVNLSAGVSDTVAGGAGGIDYQINPDMLWGFAAGASTGNFAVPDRSTTGNLEGGHFGVYGVARQGPYYLFGDLTFAHYANTEHRTIATGILPTELAGGAFGSNFFGGHLEVGRKEFYGTLGITPFATIDFLHLWQDAYSESIVSTGPPLLGLNYAAQQTTSVPGSLGLQLEAKTALANDMSWSPYLRASWVHELGSIDRSITPSFEVAPTVPFLVLGANEARNAGRIDAGMTFNVTARTQLFGNFTGQFSNVTDSYAGSGGLRVSW